MFTWEIGSQKSQNSLVQKLNAEEIKYPKPEVIPEVVGSIRQNESYPKPPVKRPNISRLELDSMGLEIKTRMLNGESITIMGVAGTGKTTLVTAILEDLANHRNIGTLWQEDDQYYEDRGIPLGHPVLMRGAPGIVGCALSHRATGNFRAKCPNSPEFNLTRNIMTFHSLLAYIPTFHDSPDGAVGGMFEPSRHAAAKLPPEIKVVILEEAGMLDVNKLRLLVDALHPGFQLIILGDLGQVAAIGSMSILALSVACTPYYELTKVHRNKGDILATCMAIRAGTTTYLPPGGKDVSPDRSMVRLAYPPEIVDVVQANNYCANVLYRFFESGKYIPGFDLALAPQHGRPDEWGNPKFGIVPIWEALGSKIDKYYGRLTYHISTRRGAKIVAVGDVMFCNLGKGLHEFVILMVTPNPKYKGNNVYMPRRYGTRHPDTWRSYYASEEAVSISDITSFDVFDDKLLDEDELEPIVSAEAGQSRKSPFTVVMANITEVTADLVHQGYEGADLDFKLREAITSLMKLALSTERAIEDGGSQITATDVVDMAESTLSALGVNLPRNEIHIITSAKDIANLIEPIITVHKSQGLEGRNVFMLTHNSCNHLSREILYTGVSRARAFCVVISHGGAWGVTPKGEAQSGVCRVGIKGVTATEKAETCKQKLSEKLSRIKQEMADADIDVSEVSREDLEWGRVFLTNLSKNIN